MALSRPWENDLSATCMNKQIELPCGKKESADQPGRIYSLPRLRRSVGHQAFVIGHIGPDDFLTV